MILGAFPLGIKGMQSVVELIRDLLVFVVAMFALLIALVVVVSRMPDDNPLKRILSALSWRVGATFAAGALAIPIEPIPGLDTLYDIGVPIALLWYWFTFFKDAARGAEDGQPSDFSPEAAVYRTRQPMIGALGGLSQSGPNSRRWYGRDRRSRRFR